jgi:hypothetical protein
MSARHEAGVVTSPVVATAITDAIGRVRDSRGDSVVGGKEAADCTVRRVATGRPRPAAAVRRANEKEIAMKTSYLSLCLPILGLVAFAPESHATTYAGQACVSKTAGAQLTYLETGAKNLTASAMSIACPAAHVKDGGTAAVDATIYFVNDSKSKTCFLDNFNIDTGSLAIWTSAVGTARLVFPTLNPTLAFQPYVFNCSLPGGSSVNGFYVAES